jgi:hypothetical protein
MILGFESVLQLELDAQRVLEVYVLPGERADLLLSKPSAKECLEEEPLVGSTSAEKRLHFALLVGFNAPVNDLWPVAFFQRDYGSGVPQCHQHYNQTTGHGFRIEAFFSPFSHHAEDVMACHLADEGLSQVPLHPAKIGPVGGVGFLLSRGKVPSGRCTRHPFS